MDRGAQQATFHGVTKSRTQLKWLRTQRLEIKSMSSQPDRTRPESRVTSGKCLHLPEPHFPHLQNEMIQAQPPRSVGSCAVAQSCPTLCEPMDCSSPDSSVHSLPQFAHIHVPWVGDAILSSAMLTAVPIITVSEVTPAQSPITGRGFLPLDQWFLAGGDLAHQGLLGYLETFPGVTVGGSTDIHGLPRWH